MEPVNPEIVQMDTIGARLRAERKRLGMTQERFAALGGSSKPSQVRYENDERSPDGNILSLIAKGGADVLYILTGERSAANLPAGVIKAMQQTLAHPSEFAPVPVYGAELAAGDGVENTEEEVVGHMAFRRDWLRKIGVSPGSAVIARTNGDSMAPTIHGGDVVLVDTSKQLVPLRTPLNSEQRHRAPIFALRGNEGAQIKRLLRPAEDQLMIISDNPHYLPRIMQLTGGAESNIIGKVVWWGHTNWE